MSVPAIHIENLTKIYSGDLGKKPVIAVNGLNLDVEKGEVFAFLGPNGAGKSTTLKTLMRLLFPTKGKIEILGVSNQSPKAMIPVGFLPEQPQVYGYLTGREFLNFIGRLFRIGSGTLKTRVDQAIGQTGLQKRADSLIRTYSRGMVQRLGLAQALINDPELLVLDEPMSNLDPIGRKEFRDLILELKNKGKTLFFSSHILSDAEMIADRVGILREGRLVRSGRLAEMIQSKIKSIEVLFILPEEKINTLGFDAKYIVRQDEQSLIRLEDEKELQNSIQKIMKAGGQIVSVIPQKQSLEELFMTEMGG